MNLLHVLGDFATRREPYILETLHPGDVIVQHF